MKATMAATPISATRYGAIQGLLGRVVHTIGLQIVGRDLPPGTLLPNETDWCEQLGVSRTVLREATKILISKGLLGSRPRTGTRVRPPEDWNLLDPDVLGWQMSATPHDRFVRELFELRRVVEPAVAALAAARASDRDVHEMESAYREMEQAVDDSQRFVVPDQRFHRAILTAAGNDMLRSLGGAIGTALTLSLHLSLETPRGQRHSLPLHHAVLDAVRDRAPERARQAMERLIDDAESDVWRALGIRPQAGQASAKRRRSREGKERSAIRRSPR
ncbi:MAG: FadR/GntR family transcriptional regulator [Geminicoccaceae bacterium]